MKDRETAMKCAIRIGTALVTAAALTIGPLA